MRTLLHSVAPVFRTGSAKNGRVNDGIKVKKLIKTCVFTRTRVSVFAVVYVCAQLRVSYTRKYLGDVYPKGVEARRRAEYSADFHLFLSSFPFFPFFPFFLLSIEAKCILPFRSSSGFFHLLNGPTERYFLLSFLSSSLDPFSKLFRTVSIEEKAGLRNL